MPTSLHGFFLSLLAALGFGHATATYQGYGEGDYVLVASQIAGNLETLNIARGNNVHKGDALFTLDHADEQAALDQAKAQEDQSRQALDLTRLTFARDQKQIKIAAISPQTFDADKSALDRRSRA